MSAFDWIYNIPALTFMPYSSGSAFGFQLPRAARWIISFYFVSLMRISPPSSKVVLPWLESPKTTWSMSLKENKKIWVEFKLFFITLAIIDMS